MSESAEGKPLKGRPEKRIARESRLAESRCDHGILHLPDASILRS
jgi:hypothetical protein